MRRTARVVEATVGMVVAVSLVALVPETHAPSRAGAAPSAAPLLDDTTRLAFTDERDGLVEISFGGTFDGCSDPDGCPEPAAEFPETEHEGEASRSPIGLVFVSTVDSPQGDVYLRPATTSPASRVTCDTVSDAAVETHPVGNSIFIGPGPSSGFWAAEAIAFASDADGDWDIYVTFSTPTLGGVVTRAAPARGHKTTALHERTGKLAAAAPAACDNTWQTVNVTDTEGTDELWPTFVGNDQVAYSTADPVDPTDPNSPHLVPDLGAVDLGWDVDDAADASETVLVPGSLALLTTTPDIAETQPAAMLATDGDVSSDRWIAFTSTEFRTDGSIAVMAPQAGAGATDLFDIDEDLPPQSSEAAWSLTDNPESIAFTSATNDPYGDVFVADLETRGTIEPPTVESFLNLTAGARGIGESHPAWSDPFRSESDPRRAVAFTSRAAADLIANAAGAQRYLEGDIGDAFALDGDDRRVIRDQSTPGSEITMPYDEAGPSYSPDGEQMVYSRALPSGGNRVLVIGDAEGADPPGALLPEDLVDPSASDTDPVWSPDGAKVAFVRTAGAGGSGSGVWVYDFESEEATQVSEDDVIDLHPTWSPDGRWIMVGRSVLTDSAFDSEEDGARRQKGSEETRGPSLAVLDPDDPGGPGVPLDTCGDGCDVEGRSPAWSPADPSTVAYINRGTLYTVEVGTAPGDFGWPAEDPVAVTGFRYDRGADEFFPTESRGVIETAEDPAWSDDGTEIAFSGQPTGQPDNRGIYAINLDGTGLRTITDDRGPETEPAYAVDNEADLEVTASVMGSPSVVGGSVMVTFTLTNNGPDPAVDVALSTTFPTGAEVAAVVPVPAGCHDDGSGCELATLAPGASAIYNLQVVHQTPAVAVALADATADTDDPDLSNNTADAPYEFVERRVAHGDLRVRVLPDEQLGYVGGTGVVTVVVSNRGPDPVEDVQLDVTWPAEVTRLPDPMPELCLLLGVTCSLGTLDAGDRIELPISIQYDAAGEALPVTATATTPTPDLTADNNSDDALVDILQPELRLLPAVARPGQVVLAYGEDMPPGTEVEVAWSARTPSGEDFGSPITINRGPFEVSEEGTVRIPLLVLRRDDLGTRFLTAVSLTAEFADLETTLLVVQRTLGPPNFTERG